MIIESYAANIHLKLIYIRTFYIILPHIITFSFMCLYFVGIQKLKRYLKKERLRDFPVGAVVKNLPASAGDMGSIPGPGRSHIPWSK